jgi:hypothetical protein
MAIDPVEEQLAAYNARELERFLACYAPDVVIEDPFGKHLMEGHEAMRAAYGMLFNNSPNLHCDVVNRIRVGSFAIDEERVTGRIVPGMLDEVHAAVVYLVRDGLITHVRMFA